MAERDGNAVGTMLRRMRSEAGLSQEDLAHLAGLHVRAISDIERGLVAKPRRDTLRLLAEALQLDDQARADFEAIAGRRPREVNADPKSQLSVVVGALEKLGVAAARQAVARWRRNGPADEAWPAWADRYIELTVQGRILPAIHRPPPVVGSDALLGRGQQLAQLSAFLRRVEQGRGGVALVTGPAGIGKSLLLSKVIARDVSGTCFEWVTFERNEGGYRGWRRLLAPNWIELRRTELPPAALLAHAETLDDILLGTDDGDLAARRFPGEVADAIAALLMHCAAQLPLILVLDDAHRGGPSSDQLALDVARRVNASPVGIVAAMRLDELEEGSPIRPYCAEASDRAGLDIVVTVRVPPLDERATASLIQQQAKAIPPREVVAEVLRQTGGRAHLIKHTPIQAPGSGEPASSWSVGKLGAEGLLVLESTVRSRSEAVREVLFAAALVTYDGYFASAVLAQVLESTVVDLRRVLDDECRRDAILASHISGYRFNHDNWIDVLAGMCPLAQRRKLHARIFALLREQRVADAHRLAWHAIRAGPELIAESVLASISSQAADQSFADYAFGQASELYEVAAQHSVGTDRIDQLIKQADALRFCGSWDRARDALKTAFVLARNLQVVPHEIKALIHLERLTWAYGLNENELTRRLKDALDRLSPYDVQLRLQTQAALAMRLSIAARDYDDEAVDLALSVRRDIAAVTDPLALGDCLLGIRAGLQDNAAPEELLNYAEQIAEIGTRMHSGFHIDEGLSTRLVDLIRCGRLTDVAAAIRDHRHFAEQSASTVPSYGQALYQGMVALARGEFDHAAQQTDKAGRICGAWGESMAGEALMAQAGWRLYETGELDGLAEFLANLPSQDISAYSGPLWSLGAALIHAEQGNAQAAAHGLREVCSATADLAELPRGPSRIAILATAAMVIGHPALADALPSADATRIGTRLAQLLKDHQDVTVLAGWPAVLLGSKHRFIGLAQLAAGQPTAAAEHLRRATEENQDFRVLQVRTNFDLARALLRQPDTHGTGVAEMEHVKEQAANLKMTTLAAQAESELVRGT
jgi:transcriptional regulator with XRE-family HTH domain/tetratricopeptide (TPR) repeat protein